MCEIDFPQIYITMHVGLVTASLNSSSILLPWASCSQNSQTTKPSNSHASSALKTSLVFLPSPRAPSFQLSGIAGPICRHPSYFKHSWSRELETCEESGWLEPPLPLHSLALSLPSVTCWGGGEDGCTDQAIMVYQWQRGGRPADLWGRASRLKKRRSCVRWLTSGRKEGGLCGRGPAPPRQKIRLEGPANRGHFQAGFSGTLRQISLSADQTFLSRTFGQGHLTPPHGCGEATLYGLN